MRLFNRVFHKSTNIVATNVALTSWCNQSQVQSSQFVRKVELCTALSAGDDAWGTPLSKNHRHTLLQVFLAPTSSGPGTSEDILLVERVLSTGGAFHSVTPISETFSPGGTLFHPDVHDRICLVAGGPSTSLAQDLEVERTLTFGEGKVTVAQFAQIIALVSRMTRLICDGGDCEFQSRSFAFTCLAALAPTLPSRQVGETASGRVKRGEEATDDSVFELGAEAFLSQVPWLVSDAASWQAIGLIDGLKYESRGRPRARLYH